MPLPAAPNEAGGAKLHYLVDDNAGANRANAFRGYKGQDLNGDRVADVGVYPTSGSLEHGYKATTGTTRVALSATAVPCQGVLVKADPDNAGTIVVGDSLVTADKTEATAGWPLAPGESVGVPCRDAAEVFIRRIGGTDLGVYWIASAD